MCPNVSIFVQPARGVIPFGNKNGGVGPSPENYLGVRTGQKEAGTIRLGAPIASWLRATIGHLECVGRREGFSASPSTNVTKVVNNTARDLAGERLPRQRHRSLTHVKLRFPR